MLGTCKQTPHRIALLCILSMKYSDLDMSKRRIKNPCIEEAICSKSVILMSNIYSKSLNFDDPQLKRGGMHVKIFAVRYHKNVGAVCAIGRLVAEEHLGLFPTNLAASVCIHTKSTLLLE